MRQSNLEAVRRAVELVPRQSRQGTDMPSMRAKLDKHLHKYMHGKHQLQNCHDIGMEQLHATERELSKHQSSRLQQAYQRVSDPRGFGFYDQTQHQQDEVSGFHTIQSAICHRVVMQYVHLVPKAKLKQLAPLHLPTLPTTDLSLLDQSEVSAEATQFLDNATQCVRCHIAASNDGVDTDLHIYQPRAWESPPDVLPWPTEFDVTFGLYIDSSSQVLRNSTSHMYFSHDVPSMHIQHSQCPYHFLPQIPDIPTSCNLTFHKDGLWIVWPSNADKADDISCCQVIKANMTANLGLNELGGFDFLGMANTSNYHGDVILAEVWSNGPGFPIAPAFKIMIDPRTQEDVHYYNGGSYPLQWWLHARNVAPQPRWLFELPVTGCNRLSEHMNEAKLASTAPIFRELLLWHSCSLC
eukprot:TRINITY_DN2224_c0_g1_i1.p1 TRINITY_DN2224_c0_g1~~TRINITY_DN2224_c0_g1_i1.p1  ORF type:complete len:410 (+),score=67.40 TRINITY_DN2224_c0_g1_i1:294-1523(+)